MMWQYIILIFIGIGAGTIISSGVFALISSTGLVTKFATKTHTASHVRIYEDFIIIGGLFFNILWIFELELFLSEPISLILEGITGIMQGIFVGCLAVSISEALDATAIFARRIKLKAGIGFIVLSVALGKVIAAFIQFYNDWSM